MIHDGTSELNANNPVLFKNLNGPWWHGWLMVHVSKDLR